MSDEKEADLSSVLSPTRVMRFNIYAEAEAHCARQIPKAMVPNKNYLKKKSFKRLVLI